MNTRFSQSTQRTIGSFSEETDSETEEKTELSIWQLTGNQATELKRFVPYEADSVISIHAEWAEFAANGEFITCSDRGHILGWDFESCQPTFEAQTLPFSVPAFSPDHTILAYVSDQQLVLLNVENRTVVGMLPAPSKLSHVTPAFSPSGDRVACIGVNLCAVWNVQKGTLESEIPLQHVPVRKGLGFTDDNFLLVGGTVLIDLSSEIQLWRYLGTDAAIVDHGIAYLAGHSAAGPGKMYGVKLPHPQALKMLETVKSNPSMIAFRAGDPVKIDVSQLPANLQQEVRAGLSKSLSTANSPVSDTAPVTLVATLAGPTNEKVRFMMRGECDFQTYATSVKMMCEGNPVWGTTASNKPVFVSLDKGETLESELRKLGEKPNLSFVERIQFPKVVLKSRPGATEENSTLGSSNIHGR